MSFHYFLLNNNKYDLGDFNFLTPRVSTNIFVIIVYKFIFIFKIILMDTCNL